MFYYWHNDIYTYNRENALLYSHRWALTRNPAFYDFELIGGDCTNFISQCLYAGSGRMNYNGDVGWYYNNINDRAPAWTGVPYLYDFLTRGTQDPGPYGQEVDVGDIEVGDVIQLAFNKVGNFGHSLFVVQHGFPASAYNILINTHTDDRQNYPLINFHWERIRFIKILGVR